MTQVTAANKNALQGTFNYDKQFLSAYDSSLIELKIGSSSVLVSPKYQAKVFTSSAAGGEGQSFGWINYKAFDAEVDPHMNAYGGENRLWLGPEGGRYSLYFEKGKEMVFDNWKTPAPIDTEAWELVSSDEHSATMKKDMQLINYTGSMLSMRVERSVEIHNQEQVEKKLGIRLNDSVKFVGYATENVLINTGNQAWNESTGMPCIWILDMFNPSGSTTIVVPVKEAAQGEKVATTDYFGEIDDSRLRRKGSSIFFKADGGSRGKMGVLPSYVKPVAGSYNSEENVLTITWFSIDNNGKYLNQVWNTQNEVFSGDAMNAYNDGPLEDGSQMGPFYEIESVSPAAALKPGEKMSHDHNVYHFTGDKSILNSIAVEVLGVGLETIEQAFK